MSTEIIPAFKDHGQDVRESYYFPNGWGVSIIRTPGSYGYYSGLFELAVLDSTGELSYDTPVTDDVLGYLTFAEVVEAMRQVSELAPEMQEVTA